MRNADVPVLRLSYGEGGALVREENLAAGFVVEHEEDFAVVGDDAYRVVRTTHRSPPPESAVRARRTHPIAHVESRSTARSQAFRASAA